MKQLIPTLTVAEQVSAVVKNYLREDFQYEIQLARRGEKPVSDIHTVEDMKGFIKSNPVIRIDDLQEVAEISLAVLDTIGAYIITEHLEGGKKYGNIYIQG